jgi:thiol:disulfide interchange protein DsbD
MSRRALLAALLVPLAACAAVGAEPEGRSGSKLPPAFLERATATVQVVPPTVKRGETVTVKLTVTPKPGAWSYPAFPKDAGQTSKNTVELPDPGDLIFIGKVTDPSIKWDQKPRDGSFGEDEYTHDPITWELKAVVSPQAQPGPHSVPLKNVWIQVCDMQNCVRVGAKELPRAEFTVEDGESKNLNQADLDAAGAAAKRGQPNPPAASVEPADRAAPKTELPPGSGETVPTESRKVAKPTDAYTRELDAITAAIEPVDAAQQEVKQEGIWAFVVTAAVWGLISLVTPCVFPMIPITVSIFLKQAHGSLRERLKLAGVYCFTIISVLGVSAFALLKFMAWLSTQPATNLLLAGVFGVLALSLFGMYEIALPNVIQRRLQARQAQGGMIGTVFGALTFTVISFTCVAPFLGGFAGISAGSDSGGGQIAVPTVKEIAGGLAFATAFAAPFFVLALVPGLMKALPRSGGWLDSVKVVMGFLELAAALKFLRNAELGLLPTTQYFTFDAVLVGWIVISAACGLYLLNVYRLPHDEEQPSIGVPRLLFALAFLGLALYLTPATFKGADGKPQRPSGVVYAWVEAFLLPEATPQAGASKDEIWRTDPKDAIEAARASGRPIFVDFTGVTCTNCNLNEHNVFPLPAVREEFRNFERLKLYTDWVPPEFYRTDPGLAARKAEGEANREFQSTAFKDIKLPLYAVLVPQPDGKVKVVGAYPEGKINEPVKFVEFLKDAQQRAKPKK